MNERGNGWFGLVILLYAGVYAGAGSTAAADEATGPPSAGRQRSVFARSPEVRLRERPDEQAATVELSLAGVRLQARQTSEDWLQVDSHWVRDADVVDLVLAIDYFTAEISRTESVFGYLGRARARALKGEFDKAEADLSEALRLDSHCARAHFVRGVIAAEMERNDTARRYLDRAIELVPGDAISLEVRGIVWFNEREFDKAHADFDAAIANSPTDSSPRRWRGYVWNYKHEYEKAIADFDAAIELDATDAAAFAGRAAARGSRHEHDRAIGDATEAIRLDPKLAHAFIVRGTAQFYRGDLAAAVSDLDEAVRLNPADVYAYQNRAYVRYGLKRLDEALADFTQAISLDADNADAYLARAAVWREKGDFANAVIDLSEFLRRRPGSADIYAQRGWLRVETDAEAAFEDAQEALRLDPRSVNALLVRAAYWRIKGQYAKTAEACSAALAIEPENFSALVGRGEARLKLGQPEKALTDVDAACRLNPAEPNVFCYRAQVYNNLGDYDRAIDDCHTALKLDARGVDVWTQLCYARVERKDYALGIDDATAAIAIDAKNSYFWTARAWCRLQLEQFDKAIADYEEVASLDPTQAQTVAQFVAYSKQLQKSKANIEALPRETPLFDIQDWCAGNPVDAALKKFGELAEEKNDTETLIDLTADAAKLHQQGLNAIGERKFAEAVAVLTRASARADDALRPTVEHDLAWLLAVAPDDKVRDGKRAIELAEKVLAVRGGPHAGLCDTLAAAYAAQGAFDEAIRWQTKAIELQKKEQLRERYRQRLSLYQAGKPYRLP
jgi:tetratricopeptide (TPR) repeat protein